MTTAYRLRSPATPLRSEGGIEDIEERYRRYSRIVHSEDELQSRSTTIQLIAKIFKACFGTVYTISKATFHFCLSFYFCLTLILLIFICTVVAWIIFINHPTTTEVIQLTAEESHLIIPNSYLFKYLEVSSSQVGINTFYYNQMPVPNFAISLTLNETLELEPHKFKYWARFLNRGSNASMFWQFNHDASLYVIRGENHLQNWVKAKENFRPIAVSSKGSSMYYFNESDDYFIIFENDKKKEELRGRLAFIISASTYDTSKAAGYFDGNFRMDFTFGKPYFIVLTNPSLIDSKVATLEYRPRSSFIFFFATFLEGLCCLFLLCKKSSESEEFSSGTRNLQDRRNRAKLT